MADDKDDGIDGTMPLTPSERMAIRRIIRNQARVDWLMSLLRIWASWASATIIGAYATYEAITKFFRKGT
jgi:hypothetical protein